MTDEIPEDIKRMAAKAWGHIRIELGFGRTDTPQKIIEFAILEERRRAGNIGYAVCASTRHVALGDKVHEAITGGRAK